MGEEETAIGEIANICSAPVKYVRIEGVSGLRFVNVVWIPQTNLTHDKLQKIESCLLRLPRIHTIIADKNSIFSDESATFQDRHPDIFVGTSVGFSYKPQYQFAYPTKKAVPVPKRDEILPRH